MAGKTTFPGQTTRRSHYGQVYERTWRGKKVISTWPRRRPGRPTPAQQEAREQFTAMVRAVQDMMAIDHLSARLIAEESLYTWRDVASRAVMGRLFVIPGLTDMSIQEELDQITAIPGSILWRRSDGWVGLAPGELDQQLTMQGSPPAPAWVTPVIPPPPPSGGTGLFADQITAPPLATAWGQVNFSAGTVLLDNPDSGIFLGDQGYIGGDQNRVATLTAPTPPYTRTGLIIPSMTTTNFQFAGIGWRDSASGKLTIMTVSFTNPGAASQLRVLNWNSPTSYNGDPVAGISVPYRLSYWFRIEDDGTNIKCYSSFDGQHFLLHYSAAKASAFQGASGYNQVAIAINKNVVETPVTGISLLSWG